MTGAPDTRLASALRVVPLVALTALTGLSFAGVFAWHELVLPVLVVSIAATVLPFVLRARASSPGRGVAVALAVAVVGFLISNAVAVQSVSPLAVRDGVVDGWARLLSGVPPVDFSGPAVAVPLLAMWLVGLVSVELDARRRTPVLVAVPGLLGMVVGTSFGTGDPLAVLGRRAPVLAALAVFAVLYVRRVTSAPGATVTWGRVARTAVPAGAFVAVATIAGVVVGPHLPGAGSRPPALLRDHFEAPQVTRPLVNPMALLAAAERSRAQSATTPPATVFKADSSAPTERYRLAVLDNYDGRQWQSTSAYAPAGHDITPTAPEGRTTARVTQDITVVGDIGGFWLPAAGDAVQISTPVLVDPASGTIATADPAPGLHYVVTSDVPTFDPEQLQSAHIAEGEPVASYLEVPTGVPDSLRTLSRTATASSTFALQQAFALQELLRTHYKRRPPAQAIPGHSLSQLTAFLTNPQQAQGSPEQFAAAFALLARLDGLPSRLVVGYRGSSAAGPQDVTAADLTVWPEVQFAELGWVPFDPTPDETAAASDTGVAAVPGAPTNEAIAQAAAGSSADATTPETVEEETPAPEDTTSATPVVVALVIALLALALVIVVGIRAVRRRTRRRRRRRAETARQQVMGAWDEALDRLTEAGLDRTRVDALTAPEVVHRGVALAGDDAGTELRGLADLANVAWYGDHEPTATDATSAWTHEEQFERHLRARRTTRERVRAGLR